MLQNGWTKYTLITQLMTIWILKMMGVFEGQTHGVAERQTQALWLQFPKGPQEMMSGTTIL